MWGTFSFASASKPICARILDITLAGNTIKGNFLLVYDTPMVEINLFLMVVPWRITHTLKKNQHRLIYVFETLKHLLIKVYDVIIFSMLSVPFTRLTITATLSNEEDRYSAAYSWPWQEKCDAGYNLTL